MVWETPLCAEPLYLNKFCSLLALCEGTLFVRCLPQLADDRRK